MRDLCRIEAPSIPITLPLLSSPLLLIHFSQSTTPLDAHSVSSNGTRGTAWVRTPQSSPGRASERVSKAGPPPFATPLKKMMGEIPSERAECVMRVVNLATQRCPHSLAPLPSFLPSFSVRSVVGASCKPDRLTPAESNCSGCDRSIPLHGMQATIRTRDRKRAKSTFYSSHVQCLKSTGRGEAVACLV